MSTVRATGALLAGLMLCDWCPADEVTIVKDRRPLACILLSPDAHQLEKEAAEDLQRAVLKAAAVRLRIVDADPQIAGLILIRVGSAAGTDRASDLNGLPYDGGVVHAGDKVLDIVGPTPAGTANAMATALMEDLGARMYYPDERFAIVPKSSTLVLRPRVVKPAFDYRVWSGVVGADAAAYQRLNRLSHRGVPVPYFGFGHNLGRIISVEELGESHPEYFAFRDGRRRPEGSGVGHATQPCFTNPDVIRLTIEAARQYFDEHPDRNTFSLCVNDNPRYCACESCSALDTPYRDLPVGRQYSESYFDYVSKVAEAVAQSHPDRYLGVYAYWNVEQPPRNRETLPDNVIVALTLDILQHYDPAYREKDRALVKAWSGYANRLHTYVYYGLGWYTPRMSPRLAAEDLRFCADHGVRAIYCEAYPFWAWCGPMHYVASRLQWDVKADSQEILAAFHRDCFGDVATEMSAFHEACERYWTQPRPGRWFEGLDRLGPEEAMSDPAILHEASGHLEAALTRTKDGAVRQRLRWIKRGFDFTMAICHAFEARQLKESAESRLRALAEAGEEVESAHAMLLRDVAYKHTYYQPGGRFERKCWGWFQNALRAEVRPWWDAQSDASAADIESRWQAFARQTGLSGFIERHELKIETPPQP